MLMTWTLAKLIVPSPVPTAKVRAPVSVGAPVPVATTVVVVEFEVVMVKD